MEEIILLSSDSSYPPSPEPIETIDNVYNSLENHSTSEKDVNSSFVLSKRPANHPFSSSDESDDSLPVPPSFDCISPKKLNCKSDSSDISVLYEISSVAQTNSVCSSTDVISNSCEINIEINDVEENDNLCLKMTEISDLNEKETPVEREDYEKQFKEEGKMQLGLSKEKDINSSLSIRKRQANFTVSSSDESDDSLPVLPSYEAILPKERSLSSDSMDINFHSEELRNVSQNSDICPSAKIITYSDEINLKTKYVEGNDDNMLENKTAICDLSVQNVNKRKTNATKKASVMLSVEEKKKMKIELARAKALKKASSLALKNKKQSECLKNIQVVLDQSLLTEEYGGDILLSLKNSDTQYEIKEQLVSKSVTWVKFVNNYHVDDEMKIVTTTDSREECNSLVVMSASEIVDLVHQNKLRYFVKEITSILTNKRINVIIYKLGEYYRLQNLHNQRKFKAHCRGQQNNTPNNEEYKVSRDDIEKALMEIQIFESCSHKFVETSSDLGSLIANFTKALAERDFKLEKRKEEDTERTYVDGNAYKKIKVDKKYNGLINLWKRHICQFNNVNVDVADAVVSMYPSPSSLILAYDNCSRVDGQKLLQDVRIRRAPGPLSSVRNVGKALSNSVYNFYSSLDGASNY